MQQRTWGFGPAAYLQPPTSIEPPIRTLGTVAQ